MGAYGYPSLTLDNVRVRLLSLPPNKPCLLLRGDNEVASPIGNGILCVAGSTQRSQVEMSNGGGTVYFNDFNGGTFGSVSNVGAATKFQAWYRDPQGPCAGGAFNFTNAVSITYLP